MIRDWLIAFVFTQLVEVPIYSVAMPCSPLVALGASAITHPIVWFVIFNPRWQAGYLARTAMAEAFAVVVEALYFAVLFRKRRAWLWSLLANAASFGAGLASRTLFGLP